MTAIHQPSRSSRHARAARGCALAAGMLLLAWSVAAAPAGERRPLPAAAASAGGPGGIVEMTVSRESGVVSAWLGNGVRLHHRRMTGVGEKRADRAGTAAEPRVLVSIALAGGELHETGPTLGLTVAAQVAWRRPATLGMDSRAMAVFLRERRIILSEYSTGDAMVLRVEAPAAELGAALRTAASLITEPVVEDVALRDWADRAAQRLGHAPTQPRWVLSEALREAMLPGGEIRFRPASVARLGRITARDAQSWLDRLLTESPPPMEVTIVGDIPLAEALRLAEAALGPLPARERISPGTLSHLRGDRGGGRALQIVLERPIDGGRAIGGAGFLGTDDIDLATHRALTLAAMVLDERLTVAVRERGWGGISDVLTTASPGGFSPGMPGVVLPAAFVEPRHAEAAADLVAELVADLAARGPTEDELRRAREMTLHDVRRTVNSPWYWSAVLARSTYRGYTPDELASAEATLTALSRDDVVDAVRAHATPDRSIRMVIKPSER